MFETRPLCINYGCGKPVAHDGRRFRPVCYHCHKAGYTNKEYAEGVTPLRTGVCSNIDGRLGFACSKGKTTEIDHIDGNYLNNVLTNVMELCNKCHAKKGIRNGDYRHKFYKKQLTRSILNVKIRTPLM